MILNPIKVLYLDLFSFVTDRLGTPLDLADSLALALTINAVAMMAVMNLFLMEIIHQVNNGLSWLTIYGITVLVGYLVPLISGAMSRRLRESPTRIKIWYVIASSLFGIGSILLY